jgi:putative transcriptional regulator
MLDSMVNIGKILLAEPFMLDPNFKRSAILLCDHNGEEGSIGFILNKPLQTNIDELIEDFPAFESEVFFGGPVQTDTIHYIHRVGDLLDDSIEISRGVYWGGDFDKLKFLVNSQLIQPHQIRFFVGYSGWSEGQLRSEMNYGSWLVASMDANYVFKFRPEKLWETIMYNKGNTYTVLAQLPEDLSWN